jgi:hypothetical protein
MGRYEDHLRAERAKLLGPVVHVMLPEIPERRDPITRMSARDEEFMWRQESARLMVEERTRYE